MISTISVLDLFTVGIGHERLTYRCQGRNDRLTDGEGKVGKGILS